MQLPAGWMHKCTIAVEYGISVSSNAAYILAVHWHQDADRKHTSSAVETLQPHLHALGQSM
jgi:hypothetical protein